MNTANPPFKVLIIDDNELFARSLADQLASLNLTDSTLVRTAFTGRAGLDIMDEYRPDCVLLDYHLPDQNGLFWLQIISHDYPGCATVMITGEGDEQTAVQAMKAGAADYLVKDACSDSTLLRMMINVIKRLQLRHALEKQRTALLDAERQRVMITSLGTACHHLGQPATAILSYMELMKQREKDPEMLELVDECLKSAESLRILLQKMQSISEYRTIPYISSSTGSTAFPETLLDLNQTSSRT